MPILMSRVLDSSATDVDIPIRGIYDISLPAGRTSGHFKGDILPNATASYDFGTSDYKWRNLWLSGTANLMDLAVDSTAGRGVATVLVPTQDNSYDLGATSYQWKDLYIDGVAYIDDLIIEESCVSYGNIYPDDNNAHNLGENGLAWANLWAVKINGAAFIEMGLHNKTDPIFEEGTVLCWKDGKLVASDSVADRSVQAIASSKGLPQIIGAELVKVSGPVKEGDRLVSGTNGCAIVCENPEIGTVIAEALCTDLRTEPRLLKCMIHKF